MGEATSEDERRKRGVQTPENSLQSHPDTVDRALIAAFFNSGVTDSLTPLSASLPDNNGNVPTRISIVPVGTFQPWTAGQRQPAPTYLRWELSLVRTLHPGLAPTPISFSVFAHTFFHPPLLHTSFLDLARTLF